MRAVLVTRFGGPDALEVAEVERPVADLYRGAGSGCRRERAVDIKTRRGDGVTRWVGPPPFVLGWDVCGVVEAMGFRSPGSLRCSVSSTPRTSRTARLC